MAGSPGPGNHYGMQVKNIFMQLSIVTLKQMQFVICLLCLSSQMGGYGPGQQAPPPYPGQVQPGQQHPTPPMFVAPPPKPQRLLHSEAYLKYIEGLSAESSTISKWDQSLKGKNLHRNTRLVFFLFCFLEIEIFAVLLFYYFFLLLLFFLVLYILLCKRIVIVKSFSLYQTFVAFSLYNIGV